MINKQTNSLDIQTLNSAVDSNIFSNILKNYLEIFWVKFLLCSLKKASAMNRVYTSVKITKIEGIAYMNAVYCKAAYN